jgi:frataxin-like iron-binding protein CyaY
MLKDILDQMLSEAGLDPNVDTTSEGDLTQHIWESAQDGGAIYSTDTVKWKCSRCGREMNVGKVSQDPPDETWEETEHPAEMETINEAMKRLNIDLCCSMEVAKDVMTR